MTRDELIAKHVCVACQKWPAKVDQIFCKLCHSRILMADAHAMKGLHGEIHGSRGR